MPGYAIFSVCMPCFLSPFRCLQRYVCHTTLVSLRFAIRGVGLIARVVMLRQLSNIASIFTSHDRFWLLSLSLSLSFSLFRLSEGRFMVETGEHWTGSSNKSIDQIGKNCPKNARNLCFQLLRTNFGHFSDIFPTPPRHFVDIPFFWAVQCFARYNFMASAQHCMQEWDGFGFFLCCSLGARRLQMFGRVALVVLLQNQAWSSVLPI